MRLIKTPKEFAIKSNEWVCVNLDCLPVIDHRWFFAWGSTDGVKYYTMIDFKIDFK